MNHRACIRQNEWIIGMVVWFGDILVENGRRKYFVCHQSHVWPVNVLACQTSSPSVFEIHVVCLNRWINE